MQIPEVKAQQPSLDVSRIELSERLRRVRNPRNLALLANLPRDEIPMAVTLNVLLEQMAITGKLFDEAARNQEDRITTFVTRHYQEDS
jgi:hypothetical protein